MSNLLYNNIDIILCYKPFDIVIPNFETNGIKVNIIENNYQDEFLINKFEKNKLKLFILTPQQYHDKLEYFCGVMFNESYLKNIGFILIEDINFIPTILLRKKIINSYSKLNVLSDLKVPFSKMNFYHEIKNSIYYLFLSANNNFLLLNTVSDKFENNTVNDISKIMKDISNAMINKSFLPGEFLNLILQKSMNITNADAGFVLIKNEYLNSLGERKKTSKIRSLNNRSLFFQKYMILNSQKIYFKKNYLDPNHSKVTKIMIENKGVISWFEEDELLQKNDFLKFKKLPSLTEINFDRNSYKIKSYCAFPIYLPSGEISAFIILINKRASNNVFLGCLDDIDKNVVEFSSYDLNILGVFSNQAGIAMEHAKLIGDLKNVFESFTAASIIAIESRDPTTKGHSERVAILTVGLAEAVNKTNTGLYASLNFSKIQVEEIRYASLLHDFGKIGVREHILNKEKKLFPYELDKIHSRFASIQDKLYINILESYINSLMIKRESPKLADIERCKNEILKVSKKLSKFWDIILELNEPSLLSEEFVEKISEIALTRIIVNEESIPILTPKEIEILSIKKGSLSEQERREIESHVTHSYNFLIQIPWSNNLKDIPEIVYGHHERLDGSGYPRHLSARNIPVQAKMMAITDVFDALVAQDRPYKKAIPYDRALNILSHEVEHGKLDKDLFKIFVEERVGKLIINSDSSIKSSSVA